MKLNGKLLSEIIKKHLSEMAMDFETGDRPHPDIQAKIQAGDTPLQKVPMPASGKEPEQNFQELLASERYKQIVDRVRTYTGLQPGQTIQGSGGPLLTMVMGAARKVAQIESAHLPELEELAVKLVKKEMGIPEGAVQFDVKIELPNAEGFERDEEIEQNPPEVNTEIEIELANNLEQLNLERAKRRLINAMIQGASAKGHYMYQLVQPELTRITGNDQLINLYGVMMSILDTQYWQFPDDMIKAAAGESVAGKEEVDRDTDPPTIYARAINFPALVHEIIKGVMELFSHQGEPEDKELFQQVMEKEDTLEKEIWDLRLGPSIWERIRSQFPEEVLTDETKYGLQNWILVEIFKLEAKQFLVLTKEVMSGSVEGKRLIQEIYESIVALLNNEDHEEPTQAFQDDIREITENQPDEDINAFLNELGRQGIGRFAEEPTTAEKPKEVITDKKLSEMGINTLNYELNKAIDDQDWELAQQIQRMIDRKQGG